ncbi:hypothetical protein [Brucella sp. NBRC 12950]|uniref:hypothetical protein n=1 Tax=Brucella sp. NBRC 12950 TaxID=2994518 RepID=UPI002552DDDE|nr:hypothetical protein [Brucella sp. NBRC 12950]
MSKFKRRIDPSLLTQATVDEHHWLRELLLRWRPSGVPSERSEDGKFLSLRLAVRNGYLSFYCAGNQIAKVGCANGFPYEETHHKYSNLPKRGSSEYIRLPQPLASSAREMLTNRIQKSFFRQNGEKDFVDEVVGSNPAFFDLELALSFLSPGKTSPSAYRLDGASLEPHLNGWQIALWEAKLAKNNGARAIEVPVTMKQHAIYSAWFSVTGNAEAFIEGCRASCRYLVQLHELAKYAGNSDIAPLHESIVEIGSNPLTPLTLDPDVRYIVDVRGCKGVSFISNGHDKKLREHGIYVQVFGKDDNMVLGTRGAQR